MLKDILKIYKSYIKWNYVFLTAYTLALIGVCLLYGHLERSWALRSAGTFENSYQFISVFLMMAACFGSLPIFLGFQFNSHKANSWMRTLPVKHWLLASIPYSLMIIYGLFVYLLFLDQFLTGHIRFGAPSTQYLFVMPLCAFQIIKFCRNPWVGLGISAVAAFIMLYMTMDFLWEYNRYFWQFYIELIFIGTFAIVGVTVEHENRKVPLVAAIVLVFITLIPISYPHLRTPETFENTVADLDYFHSNRAVQNYRNFLTDSTKWEEIGDKDINAASFYSWRSGQQYLDNADQITLLKILVKNHKNLPHSYGMTERGPYLPVAYWAFSEEAVKHMLDNWDGNPVFCKLLPPDPDNQEILELSVSAAGCNNQLLERILDRHPELLLSSELRQNFFNTVKRSYKNADQKQKENLQRFIAYSVKWGEKPKFGEGDLDHATLESWASLFRRYERDKIKSILSDDYAEFTRAFQKLVEEDKNFGNRDSLYFVCQLVSKRCSGTFGFDMARNPINLLIRNHWARSLGRRGTNNYQTYVLMNEIAKHQSWEALRDSNI